MPSPSVWGPPIWNFFHTLAAQVKEDMYTQFISEWFPLMMKICSLLPCPECSQHATSFLQRVKPKDIATKEQFIMLLFVFHNSVNRRKNKPQYPFQGLDKYKEIYVNTAFHYFLRAYNVKGNMNMINESFRRSFVIQAVTNWLKSHQHFFSFETAKANK